MKRMFVLVLVGVSLFLCACQPGILPSPTTSPVGPELETSPIATPTAEPAAIAPTAGALASPTVDPFTLLPAGTSNVAPAFRLEPLTPASAEATGEGPVGFTLVVVDSTAGARILAQGNADADGKFTFPLSEPPISGHVVGLTVDLTQEQLASEAFMLLLYDARGPGFRMVPRIVTVFDSVEVKAQ